MKSPCIKCSSTIGKEKFLKCDLCEEHFHPKCVNIDNPTITKILSIRSQILWLCPECKDSSPLQILKAVPKLMRIQENLVKEVEEIKVKLQETQEEKSSEASNVKKKYTMQDMSTELDQRKWKSSNLVFVGLQDSSDAKKAVSEFCMKSLGIPDIQNTISRVWLKGSKDKPPLVIARFSDTNVQDQILRTARKRPKESNKTSRIYVNEDLTQMQRDSLKRMVQEVRELRSEGKNARIFGGRVIIGREWRYKARCDLKKSNSNHLKMLITNARSIKNKICSLNRLICIN